MPGKRETNHTGSSVLKTTTWGALIALTAATLVAGLLGHRQWTHSGDLGRPTAQVTEQSLPVAHSAVPAQRASSHSFASNPALFAHDNSSPAATQEARASLRPAGAVGNSLKWNPANFAHSSASSNDAATSLASASLSASEQQAVIAAKIAPDLKGVNPEAPIDVIVQFKTAAGASEVAADGATAKAELPLVHAQLVTVQGSSLARLAAHDSVAYISPNRKLLGAMDPVVTAVNADIASSQGWDGTGVGVAVIDSVGTVDDLNSDGNSSPSRVVYSQSFVPGDSSTTDAYGHGTHVRYRRWKRYDSTSLQNYPDVYRGIAPEANIVSLRVLDSTGASVDSAVIAAIQQAISLQSIYNIRVINLSLSRGVYESYTLDPLCRPLNPRGKQASWWWPRQATWVNTMEPARMDTPPSARPATIPS